MKVAGKIKRFAAENKWILLVLLGLMAERLAAMYALGADYTLVSDDKSFFLAGQTFAKTGAITMHGVISAQIMPGMPVLIGIINLIFRQEYHLWVALKLMWICMGVLSAFFIYKSVTIFSPRWCGVLSALFLVTPDFVWMDNLILTETPYMFCLTILFFATLKMGKTGEPKYFRLALLAYMSALMLRANIAPYPLFAVIYLLLMRYDGKKLLRHGAVLLAALAVFIIPWSIRNYKLYGAFIPLTYGTGNPLLLGTYQGVGFPDDGELDYESNVYAIAGEKFGQFLDENGNAEPYLERYISLETDAIKAEYRLSEWWARNPKSLLMSYLFHKPKSMFFMTFYWQEIFGISQYPIMLLRKIEFGITAICAAAAFIFRKRRAEMAFLGAMYLGNLFMIALAFAFDRYAQTLLPIRYIILGIGLGLIAKASKWLKDTCFAASFD